MIERYKGMMPPAAAACIASKTGAVASSRIPIAKVHKAHYVLMNIECDQKTLDELTGAFRFSDAVLRHLVVNMDEAVTEPSPMARRPTKRTRRRRERAVTMRRRRRRCRRRLRPLRTLA